MSTDKAFFQALKHCFFLRESKHTQCQPCHGPANQTDRRQAGKTGLVVFSLLHNPQCPQELTSSLSACAFKGFFPEVHFVSFHIKTIQDSVLRNNEFTLYYLLSCCLHMVRTSRAWDMQVTCCRNFLLVTSFSDDEYVVLS